MLVDKRNCVQKDDTFDISSYLTSITSKLEIWHGIL